MAVRSWYLLHDMPTFAMFNSVLAWQRLHLWNAGASTWLVPVPLGQWDDDDALPEPCLTALWLDLHAEAPCFYCKKLLFSGGDAVWDEQCQVCLIFKTSSLCSSSRCSKGRRRKMPPPEAMTWNRYWSIAESSAVLLVFLGVKRRNEASFSSWRQVNQSHLLVCYCCCCLVTMLSCTCAHAPWSALAFSDIRVPFAMQNNCEEVF